MAEKAPADPTTTPTETTKEEQDRIAAEREEELASIQFWLTSVVEGKKMALQQRAEAKAELEATQAVFTKKYCKYVKLLEVQNNLEENERELNRADVELRKKIYIQKRHKMECKRLTEDTLAKMRENFTPRIKALDKENAIMSTHLRRLNIRGNSLAATLEKTEEENEELDKLIFDLSEAATAGDAAGGEVGPAQEEGKVNKKANQKEYQRKYQRKDKKGDTGAEEGAAGCSIQ